MTPKNLRHILCFTVLAWVLIFVGIAHATIYSYTAKDGKVYYVNYRPTGLNTIEYNLFKFVSASAWDTLTSNAGRLVSNRETVKAIVRADLAPVVTMPPHTTSLMPVVDISKNITPAVGFSTLRIQPTTEQATASDVGAFRIGCSVSHMSNDDPLVYPNQQGAAHHHTFYGNTSVKFDSDLNNLANVGNSTCNGGIMNRSAYWHPTMIDTNTNAPVLPDNGQALFYYKTGYNGVAPSAVKTPPKGLRILAGNPKATTEAQSEHVGYTCLNRTPFYGWKKSIPVCNVGETMQMQVWFPQCWDGINLDSPDHKSHMAYPSNGCPATHPVPIPEIALNMNFTVKTANQTASWRLASDNYDKSLAGGYSGHADWVSGWNQVFLDGIVRNCLNASKDAHAHLLCDGRMFY